MKTDREFLDGIYEKASNIENDEQNIIEVISLKPKKSFAARNVIVAALILIVAIPSMIYFNEPKMEIPKDYQDNAPMAIRAMLLPPDISMIANDAQIILTGKITKIEKSVYEEDKSRIITCVRLKSTEILKGEYDENLKIKVGGGFIKETDSFEPYEAVFKRSEDVLLFLNYQEESNSYILAAGEYSKYSKQDKTSYIGKDDMTVTASQIYEIIKGE